MKKTIILMGILCGLTINAQWSLTGNSGTTTSNFIGTTDDKDLLIKTNNTTRIKVFKGGRIGIGVNSIPTDACYGGDLDNPPFCPPVYKLFVKDGIRTEKVKVEIAAENGWADYVFAKDYKLMPLKEVESYISTNGHLPEVPSTEEAIQNGIELKAMNILLLKKVEELTLHLIEQDKRIEELEANNKK
ncbi:MAG: hypothetical protein DI529_16995 [Chryseobacterium sp.]|nr:MAG: hypothetical protein DI529_16995 [Chryseobacterium sp.]